ncbi:MAG TPA: hypothetical protein VI431_06670 [Candidatus Acidoferrum sp.]
MEVFSFLGIAFALLLWFRSYRALFKVRQFHTNKWHRSLLATLPVLCTLFIAVILLRWSSPDVRSDTGWTLFYTAGGLAWLQLGLFLLSLTGVAAREDVVERQNPAAGWVVYGAMIGTASCYAGSNIGSGPGPEVVLFCAALSTAFLFGSWLLLERVFSLADQVTIERDETAGIRAGGWILSLGLIFGGAVAGDWVSLESTIRDFFHYSWVALLFLLGAMAVERIFRRLMSRRTLMRNASVLVAATYFLAAVRYVTWRGIH